MEKFYEFKQMSENETELLIYGDITSYSWYDSDVSAYNFADDLAEIDTDITVRINSYGGEVAEGLAIYNSLKNFKHNVKTVCDGFACSAAAVIFMAGKERVMNKGSLLMIHNAWTCASGNAEELRKTADDLEKITKPSVDIFTTVTGLPEATIKQMMDEETWITSDEALDMHFCTAIIEDGAKQSMSEQMLNHLVMENKRLNKEIMNLTDLHTEPCDPWQSYFKKGEH